MTLNHNFLNVLIKSISLPIIKYDISNNKICYANDFFLTMFGYNENNVDKAIKNDILSNYPLLTIMDFINSNNEILKANVITFSIDNELIIIIRKIRNDNSEFNLEKYQYLTPLIKQISIIDVDKKFNIVYASKELTNDFNLITNQSLLSIINDEDIYLLEYSINRSKLINRPFEITVKVKDKNNWIKIKGIVINEKYRNMIGIIIDDVTNGKNLEMEVKALNERYKILCETTDDIIIDFDFEADKMIITPHLTNGYKENIITKENNYSTLIYGDITAYNNFKERLKLVGKKSVFDYQTSVFDGRPTWYRIFASGVLNDKSNTVRVIAKLIQIEAEKQRENVIQEQLRIDMLSGLLNKKTIEQEIKDKLSILKAGALFVIDIDNFKDVNDICGHLFGDEVITEFASIMKNSSLPDMLLGRIGGDEFIAFCPKCTYDEAKKFANKVVDSLASQYADAKTIITASIGIAQVGKDAMDYDTLFKNADIAMYKAKKNGKSTYAVYDSSLLDNDEKVQPGTRINYDFTFIDSVYEILSTTKNIDVSFNLLLSLIKKNFDLSDCTLYFVNGKYLYPAYYCGSNFNDTPIINMLGDNVKTYFITDVKNFTDKNKNELIISNMSLSECHIPIYINGLEAYLVLTDKSKKRDWSSYERLTIIELKKALLIFVKFKISKNSDTERITHLEEKINELNVEISRKNELASKFNFAMNDGTMNLSLMLEKIDSKIKENNKEFILSYIDIKCFKTVNVKYGYVFGDKVLEYFQKLYMKYSSEDRIIYRVSSDNFVVLDNFNSVELSNEKFDKLIKELFDFMVKEKKELSLDVSCGSLIIDESNKNLPINDLFVCSTIAHSFARKKIGSKLIFYTDDLKEKSIRELKILEAVKNNNAINLYCHPRFNLKTSKFDGFEILTRLKVDGTIILPNEFIRIAEENDCVYEFDLNVLRKTLDAYRLVKSQGYDFGKCSINQSRLTILNDKFLKDLEHIASDYNDLDLSKIEIEVTESTFISDYQIFGFLISEIKKFGFSVSIDDFGTGYASMKLLDEIPFDILKIDRSFLLEPDNKQKTNIIIKGIVDIANNLGIKVVCEGVETLSDVNFLTSIGCDYAQGHLYARPIPINVYINTYIKK